MTSYQKAKQLGGVLISSVLEGTFSGGYAWVSGAAVGSPSSGAPGIRAPIRSPWGALVTQFNPLSSLAGSGGGNGNQGRPILAQVLRGSGNVYDIRLFAPPTSGYIGVSISGSGGLVGLVSGIEISGAQMTLLFLGQ